MAMDPMSTFRVNNSKQYEIVDKVARERLSELDKKAVNVADIVNNLETNTVNVPLSAAQGVALKNMIENKAVPTKVSELQNDSNFATAQYVVDLFNAEVPKKTSQLTNDSGFVTETVVANKISAAVPTKTSQLSNDSTFMTADEVVSKVNEVLSGFTSLRYDIVDELPDAMSCEEGVIYLVRHSNGETNDWFDEYMCFNYMLEKIGSTRVDLSQYYTVSATDNMLANLENTIRSLIPTSTEQLTNNSGYVTMTNVNGAIDQIVNRFFEISGIIAEWDGNPDGHESIDLPLSNDSVITWYKVSDGIIRAAEFGWGKMAVTYENGEVEQTASSFAPGESNGGWFDINYGVGCVFDSELRGYPAGIYVTSVNFADNGMPISISSNIPHRLKPQCLPDHEHDEYAKQTDVEQLSKEIGSLSGLAYGVCETASDVVDKEVTVSDENFELKEGAVIIVRFINSNGAASPTLNVNGTGAMPIYRYGTTAASTATTTTGWTAGAIQLFVYSGEGWVRDYWSNTTYTNVALGQGYATCSTAAATVAKTATLSSYTLTANGIVSVRFTNDVPAKATLNINSKGAKAIYFNNAAITDGIIKAGDTATFIYSTYYRLISIDRWQKDISGFNEAVANLEENTLKETDRQSLVQDVLDSIIVQYPDSHVIHGDVDSQKNINIYGELEDGTYTVMYENEDGSKVEIGSLVVGTVKAVNEIPLSIDKNGNGFVGTTGTDGYQENYRLKSDGTIVAYTGVDCTGYIPCKKGDVFYFKDIVCSKDATKGSGAYNVMYIYDESFATIEWYRIVKGTSNALGTFDSNDNIASLTIPQDCAYMRIGADDITDNSFISKNVPIV